MVYIPYEGDRAPSPENDFEAWERGAHSHAGNSRLAGGEVGGLSRRNQVSGLVFSEAGQTIFGVDNHRPKGPHLHVGAAEVAYVFRGINALMEDVRAMVRKEGFEI
jgi:hypothetical protein